MKDDQVTVEILEVQSTAGTRNYHDLKSIEMWLPARRECFNIIAQSIDNKHSNSTSKESISVLSIYI